MPFSDPMADGPTIQLASKRAIDSGTNLETIFKICNHIREKNFSIPIVLMGYYNVILHYGIKNFVDKNFYQIRKIIIYEGGDGPFRKKIQKLF